MSFQLNRWSTWTACTMRPWVAHPAHKGSRLNCAARIRFQAAASYIALNWRLSCVALALYVSLPPCPMQNVLNRLRFSLQPSEAHLVFDGNVGISIVGWWRRFNDVQWVVVYPNVNVNAVAFAIRQLGFTFGFDYAILTNDFAD